MDSTTFPGFRSNLPSRLQNLGEYLRTKQENEDEARKKFGDAAMSTTIRMKSFQPHNASLHVDDHNGDHDDDHDNDINAYEDILHSIRSPVQTRSMNQSSENQRLHNKDTTWLRNTQPNQTYNTSRSQSHNGTIQKPTTVQVSSKTGIGLRQQSIQAHTKEMRQEYTNTIPTTNIYSYAQFAHHEGSTRRVNEFSARKTSLRSRADTIALQSLQQQAANVKHPQILSALSGTKHTKKQSMKSENKLNHSEALHTSSDLSYLAGISNSNSRYRPLTSSWWHEQHYGTSSNRKHTRTPTNSSMRIRTNTETSEHDTSTPLPDIPLAKSPRQSLRSNRSSKYQENTGLSEKRSMHETRNGSNATNIMSGIRDTRNGSNTIMSLLSKPKERNHEHSKQTKIDHSINQLCWTIQSNVLSHANDHHHDMLEQAAPFTNEAFLDDLTITNQQEIEHLLDGYENIASLSLQRTCIDNSCIQHLMWSTPFLQHIDLTKAHGFTSESLVQLFFSLPQLRYINLSRCDGAFMPTSRSPISGSANSFHSTLGSNGQQSNGKYLIQQEQTTKSQVQSANSTKQSQITRHQTSNSIGQPSVDETHTSMNSDIDTSLALLPVLFAPPRRIHTLSMAYCKNLTDNHIFAMSLGEVSKAKMHSKTFYQATSASPSNESKTTNPSNEINSKTGATNPSKENTTNSNKYASVMPMKMQHDVVDITSLAIAATNLGFRSTAADVVGRPLAHGFDTEEISSDVYNQRLRERAAAREKKLKEKAETDVMSTLAKQLNMEKQTTGKSNVSHGLQADLPPDEEELDVKLYGPPDPSEQKWPFIEESNLPSPFPITLETLDLSGCIQLTDRAMFYLGSSCPDLKHVQLKLCSQSTLSDHGLWGLVRGTPRLTHLDLTGCNWLTTDGIRAIVYACPLLQSLNVSGCIQLDDYSLYAIAASPARVSLQELDFTRCSGITALPLVQMLQSCVALEQINVTLCEGITSAEITSIAAAIPWVTIIRSPDEYFTGPRQPRLVPGFKPMPKANTFDYNVTDSMANASRKKKKKGKKNKK